jgi:predicted  nucleic acid-binding Zn-ribbon protein
MTSILRGLGIGLFIAGALFTLASMASTHSSEPTAPKGYELVKSDELKLLKDELSTSKKQLAQIQLDLEAVSKEEDTSADTNKATTDQIKSVLNVRPGMNSPEISSLLENAKIIKNRKEFDQFLTDNQLAESIQIGKYELNSSMTIAEIADMITN